MSRVLVVDDEKSIRTTFRAFLKQAGHHVHTASTGREAVQILRRDPIDVVVSDILMPELDGIELLKQLRTRGGEQEVILITGAPEVDTATEALRAGAFDYLKKPVRGSELCRVVSRAAERKGFREENLRLQQENFEYIRRLEQTNKDQSGEIQLRERQLEAVASSSPVGLFRVNAAEGMVWTNERALEISGLHSDSARGIEEDTGEISFETWIGAIHPEDQPRVRERWEATTRGFPPEPAEIRYLHADGSLVWALCHLHPEFDEDKHFVGVVGSITDVTSIRDAEREVELRTTAIEQTADSVIIAGLDGKIIYVNPAFEKMTGYRASEVLGRNPRLLKSGKQGSEHYKQLWRTLLQGKVWSGRMINRRKDGLLYSIDTSISPVRSREGGIVAYVGVSQDVTETLALQEQLLHSQRLQSVGQLAGGVAHDFNNLLTVIITSCSFMKEEMQPVGDNTADLQAIEDAANRAGALTRQLLAFSRRQLLEPVSLDLNEVVGGFEKMLRRLVPEHIQVETRLTKGLPAIEVDLGQLEQVIMNLVVNARDAMPEGGQLFIETDSKAILAGPAEASGELALDDLPGDDLPGDELEEEGRPRAVLRIRDTGVGMADEVRRHIFDPFFTTKEIGEGTGLGLSTVHGIVAQSGGTISVLSKIGEGTTFEICLPDAIEGRRDRSSLPEAIAKNTGSERVLVVEDDLLIRNLVSRILSQQGYDVVVAESSGEAITMGSDDLNLDLLLTDIVMPGASGPEVARAIRTKRPSLRVLYMTGYAEQRVLQQVAEEGSQLLQKPFTRSALTNKVRAVLDEGR